MTNSICSAATVGFDQASSAVTVTGRSKQEESQDVITHAPRNFARSSSYFSIITTYTLSLSRVTLTLTK